MSSALAKALGIALVQSRKYSIADKSKAEGDDDSVYIETPREKSEIVNPKDIELQNVDTTAKKAMNSNQQASLDLENNIANTPKQQKEEESVDKPTPAIQDLCGLCDKQSVRQCSMMHSKVRNNITQCKYSEQCLAAYCLDHQDNLLAHKMNSKDEIKICIACKERCEETPEAKKYCIVAVLIVVYILVMLIISATSPPQKKMMDSGHGSGHASDVDTAAEDNKLDQMMMLKNQNITNQTWACTADDTCGAPCAKYDRDCPEGQPELWFTYVEWAGFIKSVFNIREQVKALSIDNKMIFYKTNRQGRYGDLSEMVKQGYITEPGWSDIPGGYKWSAWESMEGTPRSEAQEKWVLHINDVGIFQQLPENPCLAVDFCDAEGKPTQNFYDWDKEILPL